MKSFQASMVFFSLTILAVSTYSQVTVEQFMQKTGESKLNDPNMNWENELTPEEHYLGVIDLSDSFSVEEVRTAIIRAKEEIQPNKLMTKQMSTNSSLGVASATLNGDFDAASDFYADGTGNQNGQTINSNDFISFVMIDGIKLIRFYTRYDVDIKENRIRIKATYIGNSGYTQNVVQVPASRMWRNGELRGAYIDSRSWCNMEIEQTTAQLIQAIEKSLQDSGDDDW